MCSESTGMVTPRCFTKKRCSAPFALHRVKPVYQGCSSVGKPTSLLEAAKSKSDTFLVEGFKQVIECTPLESWHGVFIVRSCENDGRPVFDRTQHVEPGEDRQLNIEKHEIRLKSVDHFYCRRSIPGFTNKVKLTRIRKTAPEPVNSQWFVFNDQCANRHNVRGRDSS